MRRDFRFQSFASSMSSALPLLSNSITEVHSPLHYLSFILLLFHLPTHSFSSLPSALQRTTSPSKHTSTFSLPHLNLGHMTYFPPRSLPNPSTCVITSPKLTPLFDLPQVLGSVSRITKYGDTSGCIRHDLLRKFCYCRDQKKAQRLFSENVKKQDGTEVSGRAQRRRRRNAA